LRVELVLYYSARVSMRMGKRSGTILLRANSLLCVFLFIIYITGICTIVSHGNLLREHSFTAAWRPSSSPKRTQPPSRLETPTKTKTKTTRNTSLFPRRSLFDHSMDQQLSPSSRTCSSRLPSASTLGRRCCCNTSCIQR